MKLRQRLCVALAVGALSSPMLISAARAAEENPLKNAKVGDWIEYVMRTDAMGQTMEMRMKQSVVAKDETSVTLRMETTMMGTKMPGQDAKIPLDQPYEPPYTQGLGDAKVTQLGQGNETLTVGGKSYDCQWTKVKVVATQPQATEGVAKAWTCKSVPITGLVRMESENAMTVEGQTMNTKMTMELSGSGSK